MTLEQAVDAIRTLQILMNGLYILVGVLFAATIIISNKQRRFNVTTNNTTSVIHISSKPSHRYRCPNGHEWVSSSPPVISFSALDNNVLQVREGIYCILCMGEAVFKLFPLEDMGEVGRPVQTQSVQELHGAKQQEGAK